MTVWDTTGGGILWDSIIEAAMLGISLTGSGDQIIIGSYTNSASEKKVRSYARDTKDLTWELATTSQVRATKISLDGRIAVAGIYDGMVMIIDAEAGRSIMNHNTYSSYIYHVTVPDDGATVAVMTDDGMIIVYKIDLAAEDGGNSDGYVRISKINISSINGGIFYSQMEIQIWVEFKLIETESYRK